MLVIKFGGSSVADVERLRGVARIIAGHQRQRPVVVVVSAMAGVTDALLRAADAALANAPRWRAKLDAIHARHAAVYTAIVGAPTPRFATLWAALLTDAEALAQSGLEPGGQAAQARALRFSGWGERLMVDVLAQALIADGLTAQGFAEEPVHLESLIGADEIVTDAIRPVPSILATRGALQPRLAMLMMRGGVPVTPGYIARDAAGRMTTLGRNGSDHSAAIISAALGAEALYIYSDVAGIYSADPRVVPEAQLLPTLTYAEASEVALAGARVLHPHTVEPLARWGIPLYLRSSLDPDAPGTAILPAESVTLGAATAADERRACWVVAARPPQDGLAEVSVLLVGLPADTSWADALLLEQARAHVSDTLRLVNVRQTARRLWTQVAAEDAATAQRALHRALLAATEQWRWEQATLESTG